MKKFFTFIAAALFAGSMMAEPIVINATDVTGIESGATTGLDVTLQDIHIVWEGAYYNNEQGSDFRVYANKTLTLTATSNITKVEIAGYCKAGLTVTADAGTVSTGASYSGETTKSDIEDPLIVVDDINAASVTLTCTKQMRAYTIRITLGEGGEPVVVDTYTVAGNDAAIFGTSWDVTNTANDMVKAAGIYKWEKAELNLTAGTIIAFKVAKNHSWDVAYPAQNDTVTIAEEGEYTLTITFDPTTEAVAAEAVKKVALAEPTDCATAAAAALSVSANNELYNNGAVYTINGYVTSIQTAYSDQYHNITFWMADAADGGNVLEAFRAACAAEADAPAVGDKVAVTGSLTKYNTTPEFAAGCTFTIIERAGGEEPPVEEEVVIADTLTIAEAITLGMALDSMGVSEEIYAIEGYVINPGAFSLLYKNQSWYMADDASAAASDFQAYNCFPIQNNDTLKVLAGDKVQLVGKLKKYYNKNAAQYIIEVEKGNASFISMAEGDHTVVVTTEEITVAQALEIGAALADNGVSEKQYKIRGYVSAINVKASDAYSDQYKNQSFYVADDATSTAASNADGAFYVYRGKPETEAEIPVGTLVEFTCTIKKYVPAQGGDAVIENADQNIVITILGDVPVEEADVIFVPADFEGQGQEATLQTPGGAVSATKDGVTVATDNGYGHNLALRVYKGAHFSITSAEQQIGKIVYQFYSNYDGGMDKEVVVNGMEYTVESLAKQARIEKIYIYFGEYEKEEVDTLTAAQALEIAQSLAVGATQKVVVKAYVAKVKTAYSEQYGNISVYLTDDPASTYGDIQAYQANCSAEDGAAIAEHDLVLVEGNVTHTQNQDGTKDYYEIAKGAKLTLLEKAQGIENVVLTEQVQKVVVDGVIYIVRDNKMFNLQGVQVR